MGIKKAWLTPWLDDGRLVSLSIESTSTVVELGRLRSDSQEFPDKGNPGHRRHVLNIGLLNDEDCLQLVELLDAHLKSRGVNRPFDDGGWLREEDVVYRLTEGEKPENRDSITVNMANGKNDQRSRNVRAIQLLTILNDE